MCPVGPSDVLCSDSHLTLGIQHGPETLTPGRKQPVFSQRIVSNSEEM